MPRSGRIRMVGKRERWEGKPKYAWGGELGLAVGLHNTLRFTYFETKASGNVQSLIMCFNS